LEFCEAELHFFYSYLFFGRGDFPALSEFLMFFMIHFIS
jgi:hypothetical protein